MLERVITAYKTTFSRRPDTAYLDIMVPKTLTRIRYDWATYVTLLYPRHKLADDDSPAANNNDAVVTPRRMAGSWATRCKLYERQAGSRTSAARSRRAASSGTIPTRTA